MFRKVSEEELVIADKLKDILRKTREELNRNFDPRDKEFITLYEELKRLFDKKNLDEITQEEMTQNIVALQMIHEKILDLNRKNNLLKAKYDNDEKYARVHKRVVEHGGISKRESEIHSALVEIKREADEKVIENERILNNEGYFTQFMSPLVINGFERFKMSLDADSAKFINSSVVSEYVNEYSGKNLW
jgi:type I restriction enzyme R subunit